MSGAKEDRSGRVYRRGGTWWLGYGGLRRSLRTGNRKLAGQRAEALVEEIDRAHWGDRRYAWPEAVGRWLVEVAPGAVRPRTAARYRQSFRALAALLEPLFLDEIDRRVLARIATRPGVVNATRRRDLTAVSAILRSAVAWDWLAANPVRAYDKGIIPERRPPIVLPTEDAIDRLCARLPPMLAQLARFLEHTGLRLEEAASLTWRQVDLARRAVQVEHSKSGRPRAVPLSPPALAVLAAVPRHLTLPFVFWHQAVGRAASADRYRNLSSHLLRQRRAAAVPFRIHDLRHLFAVRYLRDGGSIYHLQHILGHTSIATTEIYLAYLTPEESALAKRIAGTGA